MAPAFETTLFASMDESDDSVWASVAGSYAAFASPVDLDREDMHTYQPAVALRTKA